MNTLIEHEEHVAGSRTEWQNCFQEAVFARFQLQDDNQIRIAAVLAEGRFAVVVEAEHFCKATDAFTGCFNALVGDYATREEAEAAAEAIVTASEGERRASVLPRLPAPAPAPSTDDDSAFEEAVPF